MLEKFLVETLKLAPRQMWGVNQIGVYFKQLFLIVNISNT